MILFMTQPTYLPWIGIFKAIDYADTFVFYDDVQFERHSWQNRNRVLNPDKREPVLLSVPLRKHPRNTAIREIELADPDFYVEHLNKLQEWYSGAPFFSSTMALLSGLYGKGHRRLVDLNAGFTMGLAAHMGLTASFRFASEFGIRGDKYSRPLAFAKALGSSVYLTQAGTKPYTPIAAFAGEGIELVFLDFVHPAYSQPAKPFTPYLSIVDMLMNIGPEASLRVIRSIRLNPQERANHES